MGEEIRIDKATFSNRLSSFYSAWRGDKRSGNTVFGGVGSIVILMGKTEETNSFQKNNAMHVSIVTFHIVALVHLGLADKILLLQVLVTRI